MALAPLPFALVSPSCFDTLGALAPKIRGVLSAAGAGDLRFVSQCQKGREAEGFLMTEGFLSHDLPEVDFRPQTVLPSALTGAGWQQTPSALWSFLTFLNELGGGGTQTEMPLSHPEYYFTSNRPEGEITEMSI